MRNPIAVPLICLCFTCGQCLFSATEPASRNQVVARWSDLRDHLVVGEIKLALPNGTLVQGRTVSVEPGALILKVSTSSDKTEVPKGQRSIPRGSITTIHPTRAEGAAGRIIGTTSGISVGAGIGAAVALSQPDNGDVRPRVGLLSMWPGTSVGGYYAGRSLDRKTTLIRVLPD